MWPSRMDELLHNVHAPGVGPGSEHRARLERLLAEEHASRFPPSTGNAAWRWVRRGALVGVALFALGFGARQAPAVVPADLGRRIVIVLPSGDAMPPPEAILEELGVGVDGLEDDPQGGGARRVRAVVRLERSADGEAALRLELWGMVNPENAVADQLRDAFPGLEGATIEEEQLRGEVRTSYWSKLCHGLLGHELPEAALDEARSVLLNHLRSVEGPDAEIDVDVREGEDGRRRVRVRVRKEACEDDDADQGPCLGIER